MAHEGLVMLCKEPGRPLEAARRRVPDPGEGQVLVRVEACGVCRTDLHVRDGELPGARYPVVPGHEVVGRIEAAGAGAALPAGRRVGIAWLGWTCGRCDYCLSGRENLCDRARFHGHDLDGGYAGWMLADARYCFPLPDGPPAPQLTPLLCAGLIGYRSLRMAGDAHTLGIYGFGSAAQLLTRLARRQGREVYAFTRPGDRAARQFALRLGAAWAGGSDERPPRPLDAALLFAPVGALVPAALRAVRKGGIVVCGGIHMSDIPSFPYADLWGERQLRSVANLTRQDGHEYLAMAAEAELEPEIVTYPLERAENALEDLRGGRLAGTAVLLPPASS